MRKPKTKTALRVVSPDENGTPHDKTPWALEGIRRRQDGSLEYKKDDTWLPLCMELRVLAVTRDAESKNWGRLLKVVNADGKHHRWAMPAALLASTRGDEYRQHLLSLGATIGHGPAAANALHRYLSATVDFTGNRLERAIAATRLGWHDGAFVLPDRAIGTDEQVVYQSTSVVRAAIRERGTLDEWRNKIAKPAEGNSRLMLAVSAAFAATMLGPLQREGVGIHFRGDSSTGKTTALLIAGSVWGGPLDADAKGYILSWQATANAIESMAEAHCDLPLCLDELSLVRGEDAARMAYQLASGIGRSRALKNGQGAPRLEWRTLPISSGETSLDDKIAEERFGNQRQMAGQAVRFIDIPADAGTGFGLFDHAPELPEKPGGGSAKDRGSDLAQTLKAASSTCFGTAGPAFVTALIENREAALARARNVIATFSQRHASGADGQVQRVAQTFGLIAAAGELAAVFKVVPWKVGAATEAAAQCFRAWLNNRGSTGASEIEDAICLLRTTLERDAARFQKVGSSDVPKDRLGFIRDTTPDVDYLILPQMWRTIFKGRDPGRIARTLAGRGILKPGGDGRPDRKERICGMPPQRFFVVSHHALFAEDGDESVPSFTTDGDTLGTA